MRLADRYKMKTIQLELEKVTTNTCLDEQNIVEKLTAIKNKVSNIIDASTTDNLTGLDKHIKEENEQVTTLINILQKVLENKHRFRRNEIIIQIKQNNNLSKNQQSIHLTTLNGKIEKIMTKLSAEVENMTNKAEEIAKHGCYQENN